MKIFSSKMKDGRIKSVGYSLSLFKILHLIILFGFHLISQIFGIFQTFRCFSLLSIENQRIWKDQNERRKKMEGLKRIPTHIGLAIEEEIELEFISNFVSICLSLKIPFISLYDDQGKLKEKRRELERLIHSKASQYSSKPSIPRFHSLKMASKYEREEKKWTNSLGNNNINTSMIILCDRRDGKEDLVNVCKLISDSVLNGQIEEKDITLESIDRNLSTSGIPDMELLMVSGHKMQTNGCLPWQIRLTTINFIGDLKELNESKIYKLLERFSKVEQRFGR
eukprot:TRINITY_DN6198_c0_g1_i1.p1 TRINITY_DN6198_c0_g1~~TRINITY_DN6198_c0_g1_i1.p1  ORF type:complete len:281 (-),score=87.64 TRINITY_DN6198_c0_g1_i1:155-997(-)